MSTIGGFVSFLVNDTETILLGVRILARKIFIIGTTNSNAVPE